MADLSRQKQFLLIAAILGAIFLILNIPSALSPLRTTVDPEIYLVRLSLLLYLFYLPTIAGWFSIRLAGGLIFAVIASGAALFSWAVSRSSLFIWFLPGYGGLCLLLYFLDQRFEDLLSLSRVDHEKSVNEKNDLDAEYRQKGESVSIFFEKYSTYYNLRKLAEDFAARISFSDLSQLVVQRALEFIPKGDGCFLALATSNEEKLSLVASKRMKESTKLPKRKEGDFFDFWVIRNRKRLLITDAQKDFRFDIRHAVDKGQEIRSLIAAPLLHEGRVLGTLRLHSIRPETFTADDLRLLDAITTLASAALSNAMLFERTQELAIRDSLTGLYVQRYFFERLHEEHRRALKSGHSLSFLMCDLDHFKAANDRWGHGAGDLMLIRFAEILKEKAETGVVARYGGEEFAVLLTETKKEKAGVLAEEIRKAMESNPFAIRRERVQMTVSIGVASLPEDTLDEEELVRKADEALYRAKREGRNRVICWGAK